MEMRMIGEGAEAKIYKGKLFGMDVVAKDRVKKSYRIPFLDGALRASRTKTEAKIISMLSVKGMNVPRIVAVDKNVIYMDWIRGTGLSTLPESDPGMPYLMGEAGKSLAIMHNSGVSHGDYTPANLIANGKSLYVIDFGLSCITTSIEDKALDILLMKRSVKSRLYVRFLGAYRKWCTDHRKILKKLDEIETRGRYQTRTLAVQ